MSDGTISGNSASSHGGGVYVCSNGNFIKRVGTIYGSDAGDTLKNTADSGDGHAVYVDTSPSKKRDITAGTGVTLDSAKDGTEGGWE
jgi:hypothetical protein